MQQPAFTLHNYPHAILHIDGDAFFTSVEQAMDPALRGRPVVTGQERGIISCASYEAKALGIKRGVALHEARRSCRNLVVLPSDYESYSIYSERMLDIIRRFTPEVEAYSIDEAFADITGMRRVHHASYEEIAAKIQETVSQELGLTVSIGLSVSKGLAKLGSDFRKPNGITAIPGRLIHRFLPLIPLEDVWGLGQNSCALLRKYGISNALEFCQQPERQVRKLLGKPGVEIFHELRGELIHRITTKPHDSYSSISKGKTFSSPSNQRDFVYAKLVRNIESAFIKLRRHELNTSMISIELREKDYTSSGLSTRLNRGTTSPQELLPIVHEMFNRLYRPGRTYRATSVLLSKLGSDSARQYELFEDPLQAESFRRMARTIDQINERFGKHKVCLAASMPMEKKSAPPTCPQREVLPWRRHNLLKGESARKRLQLPRLRLRV